MDRIFAIPCKYSDENPFIYRCLDSIRKHYDDKIVVVDSNSDDKSYLDTIKDNYHNVDILDIQNNNFMTGAIWKVYKEYDSKNYYFLHDSTEVLNDMSEYERYDVVPIMVSSDWMWPNWNGSRTSEWAREQITKKTSIDFKEGDFDTIIGPMFIIKKKILDKLKKLNLNKILPTKKSEMEMMERIWGLAFDYLNIKFNNNVVIKGRCSGTNYYKVSFDNYKENSTSDITIRSFVREEGDKIIKYWSGRK